MSPEINVQTILADMVGDGQLREVTINSRESLGFQVENRNLEKQEIEKLAQNHALTIMGQLISNRMRLFSGIDFSLYQQTADRPSSLDPYKLERPAKNMSEVLRQLASIYDYLQTELENEYFVPAGPILLILTESGSLYL